jgi:CRP-like cAMP-binding protein
MSFSRIYGLKIFAGIELSVIDAILAKCPKVFFEAGEIIFQEGEVSDGKCYAIIIGDVSVMNNGHFVSELSSGDIFGEIALMSDERRSATIETLTEIEAIEMSAEEIFTIIENDENVLNKEIMRRMEENMERE